MRRLPTAKLVLVFTLSLSLVLGIVVGCSSGGTSDTTASSPASTEAVVGAEGNFISDENCLSCHGDSYETLASLTESYGDWNPHDSIHGGYVSCVNCHAKDREITDNQCEHCHAWTPETGLTR